MTRTKWIIFIVICLAVLGIVFFTNKQQTVTFTGDAKKVITEGPIADHVYGSDKQKVTFIEYGDFQCPACGKMYPTIKAIKEKYKDDLTFVFRNLPLTSIHPNALAAATAAEAAGKQGKYYEMHDMLFERQSEWSNASTDQRGKIFESFAKELGLAEATFRADLSSQDIKDKIDRDRSTAKTFDATSTPTLVLNGSKVSDAVATNPEELLKEIEKALKEAGVAIPEPEAQRQQ